MLKRVHMIEVALKTIPSNIKLRLIMASIFFHRNKCSKPNKNLVCFNKVLILKKKPQMHELLFNFVHLWLINLYVLVIPND